MKVEGMTRENVASHLQKYRQTLRKMAGVAIDAPLHLLCQVNTLEHGLRLILQ